MQISLNAPYLWDLLVITGICGLLIEGQLLVVCPLGPNEGRGWYEHFLNRRVK
jgi:hypothetical protein